MITLMIFACISSIALLKGEEIYSVIEEPLEQEYPVYRVDKKHIRKKTRHSKKRKKAIASPYDRLRFYPTSHDKKKKRSPVVAKDRVKSSKIEPVHPKTRRESAYCETTTETSKESPHFESEIKATQELSLSLRTEIEATVKNRLSGPFEEIISKLYEKNMFNAFWVGQSNKKNFSSLLNSLKNPLLNYLDRDFNMKKIKYLSFNIDNFTPQREELLKAEARLDVLMTDSYLRLIKFITIGDTDWELVQKKLQTLKERDDIHAVWEPKARNLPSIESIYDSIKRGDTQNFLISLLPLRKRYDDLVAILQKYRRMPDFEKIGSGKTLRRGSRDGRIHTIKKILRFFGDYPKNGRIDDDYDAALSKAVESFKQRMKIKPGDYIDHKTIFYLNRSRNEYLKKIITNLEILKLYPHSFEKRHIVVNVPQYAMMFYENSEELFRSDVIVGRIDRPTPIFDSKMSYMVLNPTWTIPDNLIKRDLIPVLKENPDYLTQHNIHVYESYSKKAPEIELEPNELFAYQHSDRKIPWRFVQFPGDKNALGRVKFMFPNKYSVYLHDTDNRSLFGYRYRVFSSGCMRVERPYDFMKLLLRYTKEKYTDEKIEEIFDSNEPTIIKLDHPIPIHISYFTVCREKGRERFFYDIYMYEQIIWESMRGHKKESFTIPKKRLITIKKRGSRIYVERKN